MFHRTRNVARPGQPPKNMDGIEIGPLIRREDALRIVKAGGDVYTPRKKDAYRLARDAHGAAPGVDEIHKPDDHSPTSRKNVLPVLSPGNSPPLRRWQRGVF